MTEWSEEQREWLIGLVERQLNTDEVISGYLKYYALPGHLFEGILVQIVIKTGYSVSKAEQTVAYLKDILEERMEGQGKTGGGDGETGVQNHKES